MFSTLKNILSKNLAPTVQNAPAAPAPIHNRLSVDRNGLGDLVNASSVLDPEHPKHKEDHLAAIQDYSYVHHEELNDNLHHSGGKVPHKITDDNDNKVLDKHLSGALKTMKSPMDFHTYVGLKHNPENIPVTNGIKKAVHHGYTSTSLSDNVAEAFASTNLPNTMTNSESHPRFNRLFNSAHVLKLHIPKGSHGAYIEPHTMSNHEEEYLIHKGAQFHIDPKPTIHPTTIKNETDGTKHNHSKVIMWHGHLVHDGIKPTRYMGKV